MTQLQWIPGEFSILKWKEPFPLPLDADFLFFSKTDEEFSLVCPTNTKIPAGYEARQDGWKALRIVGILDFSLIGVLARLTGLLRQERVGVFVISTYNTDYVLVKAENQQKTEQVLTENGYQFL